MGTDEVGLQFGRFILRDVTVGKSAETGGQAVNDSGVKVLFWPTTYLPGVCRGLMAGPGGRVEAVECYRNRRWIRLEGQRETMDEDEALRLVARLEAMAERLDRELP